MAFEIPKQPYSGKIGETTIGIGSDAVKLGGEDAFPFHLFEGQMPNPPKIAMEIWDYDPTEEWPAAAVEPFKDVISSPDAWARKCVEEYGADMIVLQMKSTDPNGLNRGADEASKVAKKVIEAVDVPVVVWGTANNQKDEDVLKKISEACQGKNVALGPVEEANHKGVGASAIGYGHTIIASSPIDVNLAKQLNILLGNLGVPSDKMVIDPTTGGLGYGLEYSYSVMERIRMAALTQEDDKLQLPMIANVGNEIWKCKEAGLPIEKDPTLGDPERRAILMETVAAVCYLLGGSDVVILRHPESVRMTRSFVELMIHGGKATGLQAVSKKLQEKEVDLISISPEPVVAIAEEVPVKEKIAKPEKKEVKAPQKPEKKEERPKEVPEAEKKVAELRPKEEAIKKEEAKEEAKRRAEEEAKAKAEARAKGEAEAKARAEAEAKAEEARKKGEEEARKKAEEEARKRGEKEVKAKEREELKALRYQRALEREKMEAERAGREGEMVTKTPAREQKTLVDKLIDSLDRIHKRV